jgi:hypothetical protein
VQAGVTARDFGRVWNQDGPVGICLPGQLDMEVLLTSRPPGRGLVLSFPHTTAQVSTSLLPRRDALSHDVAGRPIMALLCHWYISCVTAPAMPYNPK